MKTIADQIRDLENTRAAKAARMHEVAQKSMAEGRSMDEAEAEEFDGLDDELKTIDADLVRLRKLEQMQVRAAAPVESAPRAVARSGPAIITNKEVEEKFVGQNYTRILIAKALSVWEQGVSPSVIAQKRWGRTNPLLVEVIRANEVASLGSSSGEAGAELVSADNRYTGDFIEYLYAQTVYNRLGLREIPANVTIKGQDGAATGYWVGESKPIPVSKADFSSVSLTPLKAAALAVTSMELLRDSSPAAEMLIRDALVQAAAQKIDSTFLSTTAASSGVSPAGILNGVSAFSSSGTDGDALRQDVYKLYQVFLSAKNASGLTFLMNPSMAKAISLMVNALGQSEFPGLTQNGGTLLGDTVVTGENVTATDLILLKPSDIYRIGNEGIQVSASRDATVEMSSAPVAAADVPTGQTQNPVSMFQTESTAFKAVIPINFAKRRSHAAQYITGATYGAFVSP